MVASSNMEIDTTERCVSVQVADKQMQKERPCFMYCNRKCLHIACYGLHLTVLQRVLLTAFHRVHLLVLHRALLTAPRRVHLKKGGECVAMGASHFKTCEQRMY